MNKDENNYIDRINKITNKDDLLKVILDIHSEIELKPNALLNKTVVYCGI